MKKTFSILVYMVVLFLFTSCSKAEGKTETDTIEPVSSIYSETDETTVVGKEDETTVAGKEEETTEWVNPYAENYRVITKQHMEFPWGDWVRTYLGDAINWVRNSRMDEYEACIAIVTLTEVGEKDSKTIGHTPVYFKIEKVLDHNGRGDTLTEGAYVESFDFTDWVLCDDGTYEITVDEVSVPIAEVGSRYVVYMEYYNERWVNHSLTRPFRSDGSYVDTVAIGDEWHEFMSAETMWYYDINSEYYMEYWEKNPERLKRCIEDGIDVYDKNGVYR